MSSVILDSARILDPDIARQTRLGSFSPSSWLRGVQLAEKDGIDIFSRTTNGSRQPANFLIEQPSYSPPTVSKFMLEQSFEGVVLSVDLAEKIFWARLADRTANSSEEEAEFPLEEVTPDDWPLIVPGALFSWNIGREVRDQQVRRVSDIRFRRFYKFSKEVIANARDRADAFMSLLQSIDAYPTADTPTARRV